MNLAKLRERAEEQLSRARDDIRNMPRKNIADLVYELQVNQIELMMQNEELQRVQEELETARQKYYDLYDFAPIGYLTLDREGSILGANLMAGTLLECPRSSLAGKRLQDFIHPNSQDVFYLHHRRVLCADVQQICEIELIDKEKKKFMQLYSLMVPNDKDCYRTILSDITAVKQLQEALIQERNLAQAANQAKTDFVANMSHEIRTPLNVVVGLSNILAADESLSGKQKEIIDTLKTSAQLLLDLINDLLDISKIETSTIELERIPFTLEEIIQEIFDMMSVKAKEKNIELSHIPADLDKRPFLGDPIRIRQILMNLVSNAVKFTSKGGITLHATASPHKKSGRMDTYITVSDTGIGIDPCKLKTIFEKFSQGDTSISRKYGGTGLGLAISKNLAEIMKGSITAKSKPGKGSEFTLHLPLELADSSYAHSFFHKRNEMKPAPKSLGRGRILLVEDYKPNVMVAMHMIENLGYSCDVTHNAEEALSMLRKQRDCYIAVFMDVQMPEMDGFEATRIIREDEKANGLPRLPIIAMTAYALQGDRERCLEAGMDQYISKPLQQKHLEAILIPYSQEVLEEVS